MAAMARAVPGWSHKPLHPLYPHKPKHLGHLLFSQAYYLVTGLEMKQLRLKPVLKWDADIVCGSLTNCITILALIHDFIKQNCCGCILPTPGHENKRCQNGLTWLQKYSIMWHYPNLLTDDYGYHQLLAWWSLGIKSPQMTTTMKQVFEFIVFLLGDMPSLRKWDLQNLK